jgi:hypothetical protein
MNTFERKVIVGENQPIKPKIVKSYSEDQVKKATKKQKRERIVWSYDIEAYKRSKECGT